MAQSSNTLQKIADIYESNPFVRGLVQLLMSPVPYGVGSAIDAALTSKIENMREQRLRAFFEELASGTRELTEEAIGREDFLYAYFSTLKAAMNTRRKEKIQLFARLLSNAAQIGVVGTDTYEEYLNILDDLSWRELHILLILNQFEKAYPLTPQVKDGDEAENDLQRANRFWGDFEKTVETRIGIHPAQLRAMLTRLNRTGLYETMVGSYLGYSGRRGKLTPLFKEFANWLQAEEEDMARGETTVLSAKWLAQLQLLAEEVAREWKDSRSAVEVLSEMRR